MLLTDGANTTGVEPIDAAKTAAERGVRVYPIGFGTRNPATMVCTAAQLGGRGFESYGGANPPVSGGGYGGASARSYLVADEGTLREVANLTGGQYFAAADAGRLQDVLRDLPRTVATPAARRRGERRAPGARRRADAGRPVGGGALVSGLVSAPSAAARAAGGRARSAR